MSLNAAYAATPISAIVNISTANTNRTDTGTITQVLLAGASGTRIDDITITATATTTAGVVRLWIHNGTANFLWLEILVTAVTPSTSVASWSTSLTNMGLVLPTGYSLQASTHNAESFNVIVSRAGEF